MSTGSQGRSSGEAVGVHRYGSRALLQRPTVGAARVAGAVGIALALLIGGGAPSHAIPFTDAFGNTCDTGDTIANPNPPPDTICPASLNQAKKKSAPLPKVIDLPPDLDPFGYGFLGGL